MTMLTYDDPTIPPRYIVDGYRKAYQSVHAREPQCRYIGNHWYIVNGETVHRAMLIDEIARLRSLMPAPKPPNAEKSVIQRLIAKLRGL
ncbi:MAG: hypothetical protein DIU68_004830 [Chloroflexota bacterium]|mgnify:CR=1 FL=1|nr:MAG: hypothetical protein DIU68_07770 [Chloroflexota bacterium]